MIISAKINVKKINKSKMFEGKGGTYLDITLLSNKGGKDQYGNDGMVVQDLGKEARQRGERGEILGNYKVMDRGAGGVKTPPAQHAAPDTDDVPF